MSLAVYAWACGHVTGELGRLMEGCEGGIRLPIPAYLIEHPKGTALFDTGMHPDCQHDPAARVGERLAALFEFDYHPGEDIAARLTTIGRDPAKIDLVINSHFHFDHVGGNALIPNATMRASLDRLAALEAKGARIFFGHDPEFWQTVPQAPTVLTR